MKQNISDKKEGCSECDFYLTAGVDEKGNAYGSICLLTHKSDPKVRCEHWTKEYIGSRYGNEKKDLSKAFNVKLFKVEKQTQTSKKLVNKAGSISQRTYVRAEQPPKKPNPKKKMPSISSLKEKGPNGTWVWKSSEEINKIKKGVVKK